MELCSIEWEVWERWIGLAVAVPAVYRGGLNWMWLRGLRFDDWPYSTLNGETLSDRFGFVSLEVVLGSRLRKDTA